MPAHVLQAHLLEVLEVLLICEVQEITLVPGRAGPGVRAAAGAPSAARPPARAGTPAWTAVPESQAFSKQVDDCHHRCRAGYQPVVAVDHSPWETTIIGKLWDDRDQPTSSNSLNSHGQQ